MQFNRYATIIVMLAMVVGCGDGSQKGQAIVPPENGTETDLTTGGLASGMASPPAGDTLDAAALYTESCVACHGATGEGVGDFPALSSLSRDDVQTRLEAYRAGDSVGPRSTLMAPIAKQLSNEQIEALAAYLGS